MIGEDATMSNPSSAETLDARIATALKTVRQPRPKLVRPIVVIGAGGIVRAAHLPAYEKAGFPVIGLMDRDKDKAAALAAERGISHSLSSLAEAVSFAPRDAVFDVVDFTKEAAVGQCGDGEIVGRVAQGEVYCGDEVLGAADVANSACLREGFSHGLLDECGCAIR